VAQILFCLKLYLHKNMFLRSICSHIVLQFLHLLCGVRGGGGGGKRVFFFPIFPPIPPLFLGGAGGGGAVKEVVSYA